MSDIKLERSAELLKVLAHPIRIKIITMLCQQRELNSGAIEKQVKVGQSLISHHLIKMSDKGILARVRRGKEIYYALADPILDEWLTLVLKVPR